MRSKDRLEKEIGVELKYCEHCGGLYIRECGAGVYCPKCQAKVADLPAPAPKKSRLVLPVQRSTVIDNTHLITSAPDQTDFEAMGGVA